MNRSNLVLAVPMVFLAACTPRDFIDYDLACRNRTVTLNHASDSIRVNPPHVDVCGGYTVTINVVPRVPSGTARSRQAATGNPQPAEWLDRAATNGRIVIEVPREGLTVGERYKYALEIDGVGALDPTIAIIRR